MIGYETTYTGGDGEYFLDQIAERVVNVAFPSGQIVKVCNAIIGPSSQRLDLGAIVRAAGGRA